jgi:hypothetical protein
MTESKNSNHQPLKFMGRARNLVELLRREGAWLMKEGEVK